ARLSRRFHFPHTGHWPGPRSLATTSGVSVDVLSCRYLDVSVPCVRLLSLWIQDKILINTWKSVLSSRSSLTRTLRTGGQTWPAAGRPCEASLRQKRFQQNRFSKCFKWVAPFGDPRIKGYSHLPVAYRSVSRPSSPVHAKASTSCP